jgi:exosortase/archaeosortase family protein
LLGVHTALVLAYPARTRLKISYLFIGWIMVLVLNVIRIAGLTVLYTRGAYSFFAFINQHDLFNVVTFVAVLVLYWSFIKNSLSS